MTSRRLARLLAAVLATLAALPAAAEAATLQPLKPCYVSVTEAAREGVDVAGNGFTPGALVDVSVDGQLQRTVQADPAGNLPLQVLRAPHQPRGQRGFAVTAVEHGNALNSVTLGTNVSALSLGVQPRRARPSRRVRFRGRGFTGAGRVYAHYLFGGRLRKTVTLARSARGPCGTFDVRRRQIPVKRPRTGKWTLQVDQQRRYNGSKAPASPWIRISILVQRVFRLRPR